MSMRRSSERVILSWCMLCQLLLLYTDYCMVVNLVENWLHVLRINSIIQPEGYSDIMTIFEIFNDVGVDLCLCCVICVPLFFLSTLSCVPMIASVSGLSNHNCCFGFL